MSNFFWDFSAASPLITWGCELEGRIKNDAYERDEDFDWIESFAADISRKCGLEIEVDNGHSNEWEDLGDTMDTDESAELEGRWMLGFDLSVGDNKQGRGFELKSRPLSYSIEAMNEVKAVLAALHECGVVSTNESCGMHIHVGFGQRGFALRTLQIASAIMAGFEHLLLTLHPPHRQDNEYACNFSAERFEVGSPEIGSFAPGHDRCVAVMITTHWEALLKLITADKGRLAYNFLSAVSDWDWRHTPTAKATRTIEFRQADGTFDTETIVAWASVCVAIMLFSYTATDQQLLQLFDNIARPEPGFNVCNLLATFGFTETATWYCTRGLYHRVTEEQPPKANAMGCQMLAEALVTRPERMREVEKVRRGHWKVEQAICDYGCDWNGPYGTFLAYDEFPFTMPQKRMIANGVANC